MTTKGFVVPPGAGTLWSMAPGRSAALKMVNGDTADSAMVFEEVTPAGTGATTLHLHRDSDEIAYVLSGEITFKIGDEVTVGGPGSCAFMPRGLPHAWKNTGDGPSRVLFLYVPGGAGRFFEDAAERGRPLSYDDPVVQDLHRRHGWQIVGPPPL